LSTKETKKKKKKKKKKKNGGAAAVTILTNLPIPGGRHCIMPSRLTAAMETLLANGGDPKTLDQRHVYSGERSRQGSYGAKLD
jgi:hypothetical protein